MLVRPLEVRAADTSAARSCRPFLAALAAARISLSLARVGQRVALEFLYCRITCLLLTRKPYARILLQKFLLLCCLTLIKLSQALVFTFAKHDLVGWWCWQNRQRATGIIRWKYVIYIYVEYLQDFSVIDCDGLAVRKLSPLISITLLAASYSSRVDEATVNGAWGKRQGWLTTLGTKCENYRLILPLLIHLLSPTII